MKLTLVLFKQPMKRFITAQWFKHGKIRVFPTATEDILKSYGHEVVDIKEVLYPKRPKKKLDVIGVCDLEHPKNELHPDYKAEPCFIYKDNNVLLEGLEQAKVLTNTVEICEGLPEAVVESENKLEISDEVHLEIKRKIMLSCIFEATQDKLPKRKDPLRPAWNFPRDFGITDHRKNELLCKNLVTICEQFVNPRNRSVILDAFFRTPFEAHNKKILFELTSELVMATRKKLRPMASASSTHDISLPVLHPVDCTVSLVPYHFYEMEDIYPQNINSKWPFIQTAIVHFNHTQVKNIYEEEVTEDQFQGRSLLKGFCIAAAEARAIFGPSVKELSEPVVVPVVQTDGKFFHFTVFQLNTLELDKNSKVKNIFWNSPQIPLYESCQYRTGRPVLEKYNPDVIRKLITFCNIE